MSDIGLQIADIVVEKLGPGQLAASFEFSFKLG